MADDIGRWSEQLAGDPESLVFLPLGEALRKQGQLDAARQVATRGLERHPQVVDAYDLLARIHVDAGELDSAFAQWERALRLSPDHAGSLKGMGYVRFQQGRFDEAEDYLRRAALGDGSSKGVAQALDTVRRTSAVRAEDVPDSALPADPHLLFADVLETNDRTALLLDASGLVLAGAYLTPEGVDVASDVGAQLSGVSEEADRATGHLSIGDWRSIVFETEAAVVAMSPAADGGLLVLAASKSTPLGLVRRLLDRCVDTARRWLEAGAGGGGA